MATGARTGGEPSGAHWDHRAEARDTAGGPGRYTNTGLGLISTTWVAVLTAVSRCGSFLLCRQAKIGGARAESTVKQR